MQTTWKEKIKRRGRAHLKSSKTLQRLLEKTLAAFEVCDHQGFD